MKQQLISLLNGNLTILEQHLSENERKWTTEEAKSLSASDLSDRLLAKESAQLARDGVKQLLAAVTAYKQCIQVVQAQPEEVPATEGSESVTKPTRNKK